MKCLSRYIDFIAINKGTMCIVTVNALKITFEKMSWFNLRNSMCFPNNYCSFFKFVIYPIVVLSVSFRNRLVAVTFESFRN